MYAQAVFPVNEVQEREDSCYDLLGAIWDVHECDAFPWDGEIRFVVLLRRTLEDRVARHQLKVYSGVPQPGREPIYVEPVPGLPSDARNGIMVARVPARMEAAGPFTLSVQIDDGPVVTTEFQMRLRAG